MSHPEYIKKQPCLTETFIGHNSEQQNQLVDLNSAGRRVPMVEYRHLKIKKAETKCIRVIE